MFVSSWRPLSDPAQSNRSPRRERRYASIVVDRPSHLGVSGIRGAALMIAEGAHLLAVKERLGHSSIQVTADRYGHLFPSLEEALTDRLDASYRDALTRFSSPAIARQLREPGLSTEKATKKRAKSPLQPGL